MHIAHLAQLNPERKGPEDILHTNLALQTMTYYIQKKDPATAQIDCAAGTHGVVLADGEILGAAGGPPTGSEEGRSMDDVEEDVASTADCDSITVAFVKH